MYAMLWIMFILEVIYAAWLMCIAPEKFLYEGKYIRFAFSQLKHNDNKIPDEVFSLCERSQVIYQQNLNLCASLLLLLTQQPNVLCLQEFLGAKRAPDRAGVTRHWRHRRIQIPIWGMRRRRRRKGKLWVKKRKKHRVQYSQGEEDGLKEQKGIEWSGKGGRYTERTLNTASGSEDGKKRGTQEASDRIKRKERAGAKKTSRKSRADCTDEQLPIPAFFTPLFKLCLSLQHAQWWHKRLN